MLYIGGIYHRRLALMKRIALKIHPTHHRLAPPIGSAPTSSCLLAYYVEWHMREAWREQMFASATGRFDGSVRTPDRKQAEFDNLAVLWSINQ